jgi:hypothetical protein
MKTTNHFNNIAPNGCFTSCFEGSGFCTIPCGVSLQAACSYTVANSLSFSIQVKGRPNEDGLKKSISDLLLLLQVHHFIVFD